MKISITGGSGFVGKNLSKYLVSQEFLVDSLTLRDNSWKIQLDKSSKAIIHLAGKAHDTSNASSSEEYFKVNRDLTIQLFDEFLNSEINDFFFFSSVKAAADTVEGVLTEDITPNPITPYGQSKIEAEKYLLSKVLPEGKRLFIIRPCMIHGPGNKGNLNLLYKVVHKGVPWPLASYENRRSFLSIDNLSFLILEMLRNENINSGIYNFADDESLSTNELVILIARVLGKKGILLKISKGIIFKIAKLGDTFRLQLNSERLKKLTESYEVSNLKIKTALRIKNLPLSSREGLEHTIKKLKENI